MVVAAIAIASPLAWIGINDSFLKEYAYRIDISWWTFPLAGALTILIVGPHAVGRASVPLPDASRKGHVYPDKGIDFRLKAGGGAIDAGCVLPNITDGFSGKAPDLGALEHGKLAFQYGPRK
jgi:hypothetical protein